MKLELKHLAGYLPYGLKMIQKSDWHSENWNEFRIIELDQVALPFNKESWFYIGGKVNEKSHANYESLQFKPILRPLSDLTKEIEVNGEKFVPCIRIGMKDINFSYSTKFKNVYGYEFDVTKIQFDRVQQLLEWHFDIYGLIKNNLAIDKNTLK